MALRILEHSDEGMSAVPSGPGRCWQSGARGGKRGNEECLSGWDEGLGDNLPSGYLEGVGLGQDGLGVRLLTFVLFVQRSVQGIRKLKFLIKSIWEGVGKEWGRRGEGGGKEWGRRGEGGRWFRSTRQRPGTEKPGQGEGTETPGFSLCPVPACTPSSTPTKVT